MATAKASVIILLFALTAPERWLSKSEGGQQRASVVQLVRGVFLAFPLLSVLPGERFPRPADPRLAQQERKHAHEIVGFFCIPWNLGRAEGERVRRTSMSIWLHHLGI